MRKVFGALLLFAELLTATQCDQKSSFEGPPNFVIIFLDDSGYSDYAPFGNRSFDTPNLSALADEGCRFTRFYVPQAACSASRVALLTGFYPERIGMPGVFLPRREGLSPRYATLGEVLHQKGYDTAVFGKWHIGDQQATRPPARGFNESCGLMYSNDMWNQNPNWDPRFDTIPLQFWENGRVTIDKVSPEDQKNLTKWYTEHAVDFIHRHREHPFLLYVPHSMPHVPLFCSKEFEGKSGEGTYGDVVMEIDWSVGRIMAALRESGLEENTLVLLTSDNGPWTLYGNHAGSTPFREAKGTSFDGGTRSACIIRYPGKIRKGSVSDLTWCSIDIMPTLAALAGADLPANPIDGRDISDLLFEVPGSIHPHEFYALSMNRQLQGIISSDGHWKLHLSHEYRTVETRGAEGKRGSFGIGKIELSLFDMIHDPSETTNVIDRHVDVAETMTGYAEEHLTQFYNSDRKK